MMIAIAHVRHAQPIRVEVVERERELAPPEPHDAQPVRPAEVALGVDEVHATHIHGSWEKIRV